MKKTMALMLMCVCVASLFGVTAERVPTNKTDRADLALPPMGIKKAIYVPSTRQNEVLFVEDWQGTFGTATHPDPNWDAELTAIFGAGGYGWYATTTSPQDGPDLATMQAYQMVIWNCYDDFWAGSGLTTNDMTNITAYLAGGGKVWLIGQDIIYGGAGSFVISNFHVASYVEDYIYNIANTNIQGLAEVNGIVLALTADYVNNPFYCDDLTPDAQAHDLILDTDYSTNPAIAYPNSGDLQSSFWTIDGRTPVPPANWSQMVYQMLDAFGVLFNISSYIWDFETGHQGWTHTNGQAFPVGWDVLTSNYQGGSWTPPDAGDSTYWIDSDSAMYVTIWDTAYSPAVRPPINMTLLKWGLGFYWYSGGNNELVTVGVKTFSGGVWNAPVQLRVYSGASVNPTWDSVDVSAYASAESIQVFFSYDNAYYEWYVGFDNVQLLGSVSLAHDVGVAAITSPPAGSVTAGVYDVIGRVHNYGENDETFDVIATVYDTVGMVPIFTQTVNMAGFVSGGDSLVNFGQVTFDQAGYFLTVIHTTLAGDMDLSNDTAQVFSTTALMLGDVIYELDVEAVAGDNNIVGIEFDGTYFYVTGGGNGADPNYVYVIDTLGSLVWSIQQPGTTGWGWRDLAWDFVYTGADRVDTLYGSSEASTVKFGIDLTAGTLQNYGTISGPVLPCRALAWDNTDSWFFTSNWDPLYKFSKTNPNIQSVTGPGSVYGSAYDTDSTEGHWVWWHSQNDPGTGIACQIDQMEPVAMTATGVSFGYLPTLSTGGIAGGMCFYEGFRGADVLFTIVQATPDQICGIFVRYHGVPGVSEGKAEKPLTFGFAPNLYNPINGHTSISYSITKTGNVALKIYDGTGRIVTTLVNGTQNAGTKTVTWDAQNLANGVYFVTLEAEGNVATHKLVLVK